MEQNHATLLRTIIIGTFAIGALFAVLGVWLVYLSASGTNNIKIFGQTISTDNTGIAALFLGTITVILLIRQTLKILSHQHLAASRGPGVPQANEAAREAARPIPRSFANEFEDSDQTLIKVRSPLAPELVINRMSRISPNQRRVLRTMLLANGDFDRTSVAKKLRLEYLPTENGMHELTMPMHCVRLNMPVEELYDRLQKLEDLSLSTAEEWSVVTYCTPADVVSACNDHIGRVISLLFPNSEEFVPALHTNTKLVENERLILATRTETGEDAPVSGTFWIDRDVHISKLLDGKVVEKITPPGAHQFYDNSDDF